MSENTLLDLNRIPQHIAIIMDGNGRWAKRHDKPRIYGHQQGVESVRTIVEACREFGVKYLTIYAFSTENWNRPQQEVNALMELLIRSISKETPELNNKHVRIRMIGDMTSLPQDCRIQLDDAINLTSQNMELQLVLALSYSGRWEIKHAMQLIANKVQEGIIEPGDIDEQLIKEHLTTSDIPDPELIIRTSGEYRISNYLLWQSAYSEFYFTETLWPDFNRDAFVKALHDYQGRERRFGKISEQIQVK
ncbi:MAG: isoprenyl transferase [Bacteroidetes bacterium]|nr:isoprenyl transferase [Bacteroidota bacterium]MBP7398479.1 isoprenyl transferase [Chitinophagales bacterium]MBK7107958.1 isoprenyl transferase [Bacteroidota bacterium]MBK8486610.1 isoprenyl transferase [Bacteroidota bacterium]MBK8683391.1 isoprenyl transferase [Bacteroidota bacterium]